MSPLRRRLLTLLVSATAAIVFVDVLISALFIQDGMFAGKPLPPFGAITHVERQAEFLASLERPREERNSIGGFDRDLGWTYFPNARNTDGSAHTNSLASRGKREYTARPGKGITRVLAFGDSFVWCEEVSDRKSWGQIYERRKKKIELINFGVGGYGTDQAFLRYQKVGRKLGADVVVIGLLLENIGRNVNRYRPMWSLTSALTRSKPRFQLRGDELVLVPQPFETEAELLSAVRDDSVLDRLAEDEYWRGPDVLTGRASSLMRLMMGWVAYRERQPRKLWVDHEGEPYRVSVAILESFHRMAMADGAELAPVLIFPTFEDLEALAESGDRYWSGLVEELESLGIPVVDLSEPLLVMFRQYAAKGRPRALFTGYHLSETGNGIVASALDKFIKEHRER